MPRYFKKTEMVEAIQVIEANFSTIETMPWAVIWVRLGSAITPESVKVELTEPDGSTFPVRLGDWIVTKPHGTRCACDDATFTRIYQAGTK